MKPFRNLNTLFIGRTGDYIEETDSTNAELQRRLKKALLPEGYLITSSYQTSGRGYSGNAWHSERGKNVMMSLVLYPSFLAPRRQFYITQALSLAVHDVLSVKLGSRRLKIKWPNDIYFGNKKICGMLLETAVQGERIQYAVAGVGININQEKFPSDLNATSVFLESGKTLEVDGLIELLCEAIEARYLQLMNNRYELIQQDYMRQLYRLEEDYTYKIFGNILEARIVGLNPEGKLVLDSEDGFKICGLKEVQFMEQGEG